MKYLIWTCLFALTLHAQAQDLSPNILYKSQSGEMLPLRIDTISVTVHTIGNVAQTEMQITIANDGDRQLEGQFFFPMRDGQRISRFAMEVNGEMREGVVVSKEKGRKVFEAIVNRQIDPGLLEYVRGNSFKARVYPILPHSTKSVIIGYEEIMKLDEQGYRYRLPLRFAKPLKQFSVEVEPQAIATKPIGEGHYAPMLLFESNGTSHRASFTQADTKADQDLEMLFPNQKGEFVHMGKGIKSADKTYFTLAKAIESPKSRPRHQPKNLCIVWDQSQSAEGRNTALEIKLLEKALATFTEVKTLRLVTFNNEMRINEIIGSPAALIQRIRSLDYDGGTQLGVLDLRKYDADLLLVFSDGLSNIGASDVRLGSAPIISVSSAATAETTYLRYLAEATGGHFINLSDGIPKDIAQALLSEPFRFLKATYEPSQIQQVFPASPITIEQGQIQISGILQAPSAKIQLHYGWGNEVVQTQEITLQKSHTQDQGMAERIWANQKLTELERSSADSEAQRLALATQFGIVTPQTSLIVLDDLDDYRRYQITPPPSLLGKIDPQAWAKETASYHRFSQIPDYLLRLWESRKAWHQETRWGIQATGQGRELINTEVSAFGAVPVASFDSSDGSFGADSFDEFDGGFGGGDDTWGGEEEEAEPEESQKQADKAKKEHEKSAKIELAPWKATSEYVKALQAQPKDNRYQHYLQLRKQHHTNTGFYADVADFFLHEGDTATALLIASNIAELQLENHEMLRLLASMLKLCNRYDLATKAHQEVLILRPDEIQSYRDLALTYEYDGQYQKALDTFNDALLINWAKASLRSDHQGSFDEWGDEISSTPGVAVTGTQEVILAEINHLIEKHRSELDLSQVDARIIKNLPVDIRVVVDWDSDNFDMDLWVTDPNDEKCYYANKSTSELGRYTYDNTTGYGPEEFMVKSASVGEYHVQMNYFGTRSQKMLAPVTVTIHFYTFYGKPEEQHQQIVLRLGDKKEIVEGGKLIFELKTNHQQDGASSQEPLRYIQTKLSDKPDQYLISPSEQYLLLTTASDAMDLTHARSWKAWSQKQAKSDLSNQLKWLSLPTLKEIYTYKTADSTWYIDMMTSGDTLQLLRKDLIKIIEAKSEEKNGWGEDTKTIPIFEYTSETWSISQHLKLGEQPIQRDTTWETQTKVSVLMGETDYLVTDHYIQYSVDMLEVDHYIIEVNSTDEATLPHLDQTMSSTQVMRKGKLTPIQNLLNDFPYQHNEIIGGYIASFQSSDSLHLLHIPTGKQLTQRLRISPDSRMYFRHPRAPLVILEEGSQTSWEAASNQSPVVRSLWAISPSKLTYSGTFFVDNLDGLSMLSPQGYAIGGSGNHHDSPRELVSKGVTLYRTNEKSPVLEYYHAEGMTASPQASRRYVVSASKDKTVRLHHIGQGWPDSVHIAGNDHAIIHDELIGYHLYGRTLVVCQGPRLTTDDLPQWPLMPYTATKRKHGHYVKVAGYQAVQDYDQVIIFGKKSGSWDMGLIDYYSVYQHTPHADESWEKAHAAWWTNDKETLSSLHNSWISPDGSRIFSNDANRIAVIDLKLIEKSVALFKKKHDKATRRGKSKISDKMMDWEKGFTRKNWPQTAEALDWINTDEFGAQPQLPSKALEVSSYLLGHDLSLATPYTVSPSQNFIAIDDTLKSQVRWMDIRKLEITKSLPYPSTQSSNANDITIPHPGWLMSSDYQRQARWIAHQPSGQIHVPDTTKDITWKLCDEKLPTHFMADRASWLSELPTDDQAISQWEITVMDDKIYHIPLDSTIIAHRMEFIPSKPIIAYDQGIDWIFYDYKAGTRLAKFEALFGHENGLHYHTAIMPQDGLGLIGVGRAIMVQDWVQNKTLIDHELPIDHGIIAMDYQDGVLVTLHSDYAIRVWDWADIQQAPKWRKVLFASTDQVNELQLVKNKSILEVHAINQIGRQRHTQIWKLGK